MPFNSTYILIGAMALALINWLRTSRSAGRPGPWIGAIIISALVVEVAGLGLAINARPNTVLYNLHAPVEFALFMRLVHLRLPRLGRWIVTSVIAAVLVMCANQWWYHGQVFLLVEGMIMLAVMATIWSALVLWNMAQVSQQALWRAPLFWFFMGCMIYFAGIVPFVGMMRLLYQNDPALTRLLYHIIITVAVVRYLFTAWACHLASMQQRWSDEQ